LASAAADTKRSAGYFRSCSHVTFCGVTAAVAPNRALSAGSFESVVVFNCFFGLYFLFGIISFTQYFFGLHNFFNCLSLSNSFWVVTFCRIVIPVQLVFGIHYSFNRLSLPTAFSDCICFDSQITSHYYLILNLLYLFYSC
jgi:hypothetical protein